MSTVEYAYFVIFCITMVFSPGPMTMFLMGVGMEQGLKQTMPAQLGASSAYFVSLLIFAIGLTALLQTNDIILLTIKYIGVGYILYLAYKQWEKAKSSHALISGKMSDITGWKQLYCRGLIIGLSNPKAILMFSTVIPQFAVNDTTKIQDVAVLSMTFLTLQFLSGVSYSYFGHNIKSILQSPKYQQLLYKSLAVLLILIAVMIAVT